MDDLEKHKEQGQEPDNESKELLETKTEVQPDYDPDDDLVFNISPVAAAFIGLAGGFFLYQIIGGFLTILIFGMNLDSVPVNDMRLMTMAGQILFLLLPALLFSKWIYTDVGKIIRIRKPKLIETGFFTLGMVILTPLLQVYLYIQNYFIEILAKNISFFNSAKSFFDMLNDMVEKAYKNLLAASNIFELLLVVLVVAIVPAITEESLFRGFIQRSFELKYKKHIAAGITALFFSLFHANPYGLIPLFVLGAFFGFAAYKSKTLLVPMFLHFLNNFSAVILYHTLGDEELIKTDPATSQTELASYVMMFFALTILFAALIILINKYYLKRTT